MGNTVSSQALCESKEEEKPREEQPQEEDAGSSDDNQQKESNEEDSGGGSGGHKAPSSPEPKNVGDDEGANAKETDRAQKQAAGAQASSKAGMSEVWIARCSCMAVTTSLADASGHEGSSAYLIVTGRLPEVSITRSLHSSTSRSRVCCGPGSVTYVSENATFTFVNGKRCRMRGAHFWSMSCQVSPRFGAGEPVLGRNRHRKCAQGSTHDCEHLLLPALFLQRPSTTSAAGVGAQGLARERRGEQGGAQRIERQQKPRR